MSKQKEPKVTLSSGNVFEDLELPDSERRLAEIDAYIEGVKEGMRAMQEVAAQEAKKADVLIFTREEIARLIGSLNTLNPVEIPVRSLTAIRRGQQPEPPKPEI